MKLILKWTCFSEMLSVTCMIVLRSYTKRTIREFFLFFFGFFEINTKHACLKKNCFLRKREAIFYNVIYLVYMGVLDNSSKRWIIKKTQKCPYTPKTCLKFAHKFASVTVPPKFALKVHWILSIIFFGVLKRNLDASVQNRLLKTRNNQ